MIPICGLMEMMVVMMMAVRAPFVLEGGRGVDLGMLLLLCYLFYLLSHTHFFFFFGHKAKHLDKFMFVLISPVFGHIALMTLLFYFHLMK